MGGKMNLYSLARKFPTEEHALAHLMKTRWPSGIRCLQCDHDKCWLVESKNKTGKPRRLFQCAKCKLQFSATTGTLFHDSHLPLSKWFAAIALMAEAKKGISACQLQRHVGMTYKTAWYVCHRIREAMREEEETKIGGNGITVEIDETYIGGKGRLTGVQAGLVKKTLVLGMAERGGRIHLQTIPQKNLASIKPVLDANLDPDTEQVVTDSNPVYTYSIPKDKHKETSHKEELKSKNWTPTQTVENAFSLFKRGIIGNYHQLSPWHLQRYMREFCWRYNRRGLQPWIFGMTLNNMVCRKPLPYKELIRF
jgi:transposase-like protein